MVGKAMEQARKDEEVDKKEMYYDMYSKNLELKLKGTLPWQKNEHKNTAKSINI